MVPEPWLTCSSAHSQMEPMPDSPMCTGLPCGPVLQAGSQVGAAHVGTQTCTHASASMCTLKPAVSTHAY